MPCEKCGKNTLIESLKQAEILILQIQNALEALCKKDYTTDISDAYNEKAFETVRYQMVELVDVLKTRKLHEQGFRE